jgi:hypothetical protein
MSDGTVVWGWHPDRFDIHDERYISVEGVATKLVRDGGRESYDPPPRATRRPAELSDVDDLLVNDRL